mmetsp:Transcript_19226/g.53571  ORF Transcript_19226/g.53571 Transcript_19226/m.53571 type:complete len:228 (+) Transcript_19226:1336-2019(+)
MPPVLGFAAEIAVLLPKGETVGLGGVGRPVVRRPAPVVGVAPIFFGVATAGFGLEGGPPNPIEAKISSSEAPIRVFFLGLAATDGFFLGPRLVMPMVIPPIVEGISCADDNICEESMLKVDALAADADGSRVVFLMVELGGVSDEDDAEVVDVPDTGAFGIPTDDVPTITLLFKPMPVPLFVLLVLVFLDVLPELKLESFGGDRIDPARVGEITGVSTLSESKEGFL